MENNKINWVVTLFIIFLHIISIIGTLLLCRFEHIPAATWCLAVAMYVTSGVTITAGYHRLFSHKSYQAHPLIKVLFAVFGAANYQGSIAEWSTDHRMHHRYTDTDKDPYSVKKGFWHAHMTWLFTLDKNKRNFSIVSDLLADPIVKWQHKHIGALMLTMGFFFPTLVASLWGDPLGGLLVAGGLRLVINLHCTWAVNSICHTFGKANYINQSAKDNWITALFTWGEGHHNFHHQFPIDYRNGTRWFHYDPTKWLIRLFNHFGLAHHLKSVAPSKILQYKINYQHICLNNHPLFMHFASQTIEKIQESYNQLQTKILCLAKFENKLSALQNQLKEFPSSNELKKKIKIHQKLLKGKWKELKKNFVVWQHIVKMAAKTSPSTL